MSLSTSLIDIVLHVDKYIALLIDKFGVFSYVILFLVIFFETALVFTPFLPGDSLLFAAGTFAAIGSFNIWIVFLLLFLAAVLGDSVNYSIGHFIGKKILAMRSKIVRKIVRKEYIDKTQTFFDKHGGKTIVLARFVPIIRTFAPFLAGIGEMNYWRFLSYNVIGGFVWVALFVFGGYFFGNIPIVRDNFSFVIIIIIGSSLVPVAFGFLKHKLEQRKKDKQK
ncbi:MAG: DedA family protein [archaeon]